MPNGCKVCRILDTWGLDSYDERLLSEWRGEDGQRKGYRQLATFLNHTLLRNEMDRAGLPTFAGEVESKYDRLQSDGPHQSEVAMILEREGIDVERLRSDFVSYGVVRTHLTDCLEAEYDAGPSTNWEEQSIEISRAHAREKIGDAVRSLLRKGTLSGSDDIAIQLDVVIACEECAERVSLRRALREGTVCACEQVIHDE